MEPRCDPSRPETGRLQQAAGVLFCCARKPLAAGKKGVAGGTDGRRVALSRHHQPGRRPGRENTPKPDHTQGQTWSDIRSGFTQRIRPMISRLWCCCGFLEF